MAKLNQRLFREAKKYLVGGVNSPVRAFNYIGGEPLLIKSGKGSKLYDQDGKAYVDYVLSWGSLILGHAYPRVVRELKKVITKGLSFGATNEREIELARIIHQAIPVIEKLRFTNSGTEAVMGAIRLARGYTKRDKIIKFENSYHGHADYLLAKGGSGLATLGIATSAGVPKDFIENTIVAPFGDREALGVIFKKYGSQIAAVIVEPVGANFGVISSDIEFLKYIRKITSVHKALLIADEVVTGFRFGFGAFTLQSGIIPDLICLGKIIGGGLPIGAFGGSDKIMRHLAPEGEVYQASTFAGNPIVMQSGLTTLEELSKHDYRNLEKLAAYLICNIAQAAKRQNVDLELNYFGSMFSLKFQEKKIFQRFYKALIGSGVYFAQSEFEANFLSFAHSEGDIEETIEKVKCALSF